MEMVANGLAAQDLHALALKAAERADQLDEQVRAKREAETLKHSMHDLARALNRVVGIETGHTFTEDTLANLPRFTVHDGATVAVMLNGYACWVSRKDRDTLRMAPVCTTCGGDVDPRQHAVIDTVGALGRYYRTAEERERELGAPLCEGCWYTAEVARRAEQVEQSDQPQEDPAPPEQTPETMLIALLESLGFRRG